MSDNRQPAAHRIIASRMRQLRKRHGWSSTHLAAEMAKVGIPWDRFVVQKLEGGQRAGVTVEEFLALAYVLSVAPIHLLIPTIADAEPYEVVTGASQPVDVVRSWVRGNAQPFGDPRIYFTEVPLDEFGKPS